MTRLLLVDDHAVVREGVRRIFEQRAEETVFGEASTVAEAVVLATSEEWDAVVLDLTLRDGNGMDVLKELRRVRPGLPVLVLSMHAEEQYARRAFKAGAAGYITKDAPAADLAGAIGTVSSGHKYVSAALADQLVTYLQEESRGMPHDSLSDREFEVMRQIASGRTVREIAAQLALSDKTVSTYRARLLEKMGMRTNAELTHYAFANKVVE